MPAATPASSLSDDPSPFPISSPKSLTYLPPPSPPSSTSIDEFDRFSEIAPYGSARMQIFPFLPTNLTDLNSHEAVDTGQSYINAMNVIGVGIKRSNSLNEGVTSAITAIIVDSERVVGFLAGDETLDLGRETPRQNEEQEFGAMGRKRFGKEVAIHFHFIERMVQICMRLFLFPISRTVGE